jgi:hypothetical protein
LERSDNVAGREAGTTRSQTQARLQKLNQHLPVVHPAPYFRVFRGQKTRPPSPIKHDKPSG